MITRTNLYKAKNIAKNMLFVDPKPSEDIKGFVNHPFTYSPFVFIKALNRMGNILENVKDLDVWRSEMLQHINDTTSVIELEMLIDKPYKMQFLQLVEPAVSRSDLAKLLKSIWQSCENQSSNPVFSQDEMIELFVKATPRKLMDKNERKKFASLSEKVTIYRGVAKAGEKYARQLSWTLDIEQARWFSRRFKQAGGIVYRAEISKDDILAYFQYENEVVLNPDKLVNLTMVQE